MRQDGGLRAGGRDWVSGCFHGKLMHMRVRFHLYFGDSACFNDDDGDCVWRGIPSFEAIAESVCILAVRVLWLRRQEKEIKSNKLFCQPRRDHHHQKDTLEKKDWLGG